MRSETGSSIPRLILTPFAPNNWFCKRGEESQGWRQVDINGLTRLLTQVQGEGCPLPCTGDEGSPLDREVAGADSLGAQAVEEGDFGA